MKRVILIAAAMLLTGVGVSGAASAQQTSAADKAAVDKKERAGTAQLNNAHAAHHRRALNRENRRYLADLHAYDVAMLHHHRRTAAYLHQRRAYAAAMAAWRHQVAQCHAGDHDACDKPTPHPADFH